VTNLDTEKLQVFTAATLGGYEQIRHGFFGRVGGVSQGIYSSLNCGYGSSDEENKITENRRRVSQFLGITPTSLTCTYQVHGTDVVAVEQPWNRAEAPRADGMVTARAGIALGILTADCAPVLFADNQNRIVGACHAGWRGALDGVIESTVSAMESLGAQRENIAAAVGPCIAQPSYQVGLEFRNKFTEQNAKFSSYFADDDETHLRFDLGGFVQLRLERAGLSKIDVIDMDNCAETESFYSYRRSTLSGEQDYGRGISVIVIRE
tara:strand:- start:1024 stop:1818 length:795 start_codon:yes stop_codon:yes gene_type:complete